MCLHASLSFSTVIPMRGDTHRGIYLFADTNQGEEPDKKNKDGYPGFYTSILSCVSIDIKNSNIVKKEITPNGDRPVFMPRLAAARGQDVFFPAMKITNKMEGDCKLVKVTVKD